MAQRRGSCAYGEDPPIGFESSYGNDQAAAGAREARMATTKQAKTARPNMAKAQDVAASGQSVVVGSDGNQWIADR